MGKNKTIQSAIQAARDLIDKKLTEAVSRSNDDQFGFTMESFANLLKQAETLQEQITRLEKLDKENE